MTDLVAISHRVIAAIADADKHGASLAAEVLRRDVAELERIAAFSERNKEPDTTRHTHG